MMNENPAPHGPDFDWSPVDDLFCSFDPEEWWRREWKAYPDLGKQMRRMIEIVVSSLEGLASDDAEQVRKFFEEWPECRNWSTDWWYCKDAVERIVPITRRFVKLSPILTRVGHQQEVNVYLREATQCFLYGFFQASTALFRTALETGIKHFCDRKLGALPGAKLYDLIAQAEKLGLVSLHVGAMASDVRIAANKVIHEEPISEQQAFDVLVKTRGVLEEFYKS